MKTVALMPSTCAASATPWAWLPADAATTPCRRSWSESREIRTYAPRALNEPVRWRFSHLSCTGPSASAESQRDSSIGVSIATPRSTSRAASMSARPTDGTSLIALLLGAVDSGPRLLVVLAQLLDRIAAGLGVGGQMLHHGVERRGEGYRDQRARDAGDDHA